MILNWRRTVILDGQQYVAHECPRCGRELIGLWAWYWHRRDHRTGN